LPSSVGTYSRYARRIAWAGNLFKYSCILGEVLSCGFLEAGPIPLHAGYVDYWRYSYLHVAFAILFCQVDRALYRTYVLGGSWCLTRRRLQCATQGPVPGIILSGSVGATYSKES
jgi:hypothetical protein